MALNVCPLDYLISRTGNVILFLLLHNAQSGRVSALGETPDLGGKVQTQPIPPFLRNIPPCDNFWTAVMCVAADGAVPVCLHAIP